MSRTPLAALVAASGVATVGSTMTLIAVPWFVLHTTGSGLSTGLVATASHPSLTWRNRVNRWFFGVCYRKTGDCGRPVDGCAHRVAARRAAARFGRAAGDGRG
ncbi:hypothetical protein SAMN04487819_106222 [Actinopolyspora alba]|uniref:Uncharacterized protein n=1 Tax=Actinopolyspora alba TaxID=673379 RepID=A0A1I1X015_9ACTN|nr:hypothetical protein SAMN04487819_106222 [Actinopolyspora alba]